MNPTKAIAIKLEGLPFSMADRDFGASEINQEGKLFKASGMYRTVKEEVEAINSTIKTLMKDSRWRLPRVSEIELMFKKCRIFPAYYAQREEKPGEDHAIYVPKKQLYKVMGPKGNRYFTIGTGWYIAQDDKTGGLALWNIRNGNIHIAAQRMIQKGISEWDDCRSHPDLNVPYGYYYSDMGVFARPVCDGDPLGRDNFKRFFEYTANIVYEIQVSLNEKPVSYSVNRIYELSLAKKKQVVRQEEERKKILREQEAWEKERRLKEEQRQEEEKQRKRAARMAEIRRNRPRNKYDTGSIANYDNSRIPGRDFESTAGYNTGNLFMQNGHMYQIVLFVNSWTGDREWSGKGLDDSFRIVSACCGDSFQKVIQELEKGDFERSLELYDIYGHLPEV